VPRYSGPRLRRPPAEFPYRERHVTFIRVAGDGEILQAQGVQEKREMLASLDDDDGLLGAWTGQWRTDIFWLDPATAREALR
jgi:hypothetical protein